MTAPCTTFGCSARRSIRKSTSISSQKRSGASRHVRRPPPANCLPCHDASPGTAQGWHNQRAVITRRTSSADLLASPPVVLGRRGILVESDELSAINREALPEVALLGHANCGEIGAAQTPRLILALTRTQFLTRTPTLTSIATPTAARACGLMAWLKPEPPETGAPPSPLTNTYGRPQPGPRQASRRCSTPWAPNRRRRAGSQRYNRKPPPTVACAAPTAVAPALASPAHSAFAPGSGHSHTNPRPVQPRAGASKPKQVHSRAGWTAHLSFVRVVKAGHERGQGAVMLVDTPGCVLQCCLPPMTAPCRRVCRRACHCAPR